MIPRTFIFFVCAASTLVSQASASQEMNIFSAENNLLEQVPAASRNIAFGKDCKQSHCFFADNDPDISSTINHQSLQQQRRHDPTVKFSMDDSQEPAIGFGYSWNFGD